MDGGGDQVSPIDSSCLGMFMIQWEFSNIEEYAGIFSFIYSNSERETGRERERECLVNGACKFYSPVEFCVFVY